MGSRLELQYLLESIIGNENVYYNPPSNTEMKYPAIVFEPYNIDIMHANDRLYGSTVCYSIRAICALPNDKVVKELLNLPMCSFDRHYTFDGLNHDVVRLYY
jgi:hypothetical protein